MPAKKPRRRRLRTVATPARNATAVAHSIDRPDASSSRLGLTVASTGGGGPSALWWSSTITSARPCSAASASPAAVPQSTQTTSLAPRCCEAEQGGHVRPVALGHAVRHVMQHGAAEAAQQRDRQRRAACAVHVVVAEHADRLAARHRVGQPLGRDVHVGQQRGIRQQRAQGRFEEMAGSVDIDAAGGQQPADDLRHAGALRDAQPNALLAQRARSQRADAAQAAGDSENRFVDHSAAQAGTQVLVAKL